MIAVLLDLLVGGLFCLAMVGLGVPLVRRWLEPLTSHLERAVLAAGLGTGVTSMLVLVAGFSGFLYPWLAWLLVAVGLIVGGLALVNYPLDERAAEPGGQVRLPTGKAPPGWLTVVLNALIVVVLLSHFVAALAPPSYADVVNSYLALPKLFVEAHRFYFTWTLFAGLPAALQALRTAGLLLGDGVVATSVSLLLGLMLAGGLHLIARRHLRLSPTFARLGLLLYLSLPAVTIYLPTAKPDIGLASFAVLALYTLLNWGERAQWRWIVLSGIFAGLAIGAKTHGLFVFATLGICAVVVALGPGGRKRVRDGLLPLCAFGGVAALVGSPSYLRNLVWTGNPLWPMMNETLGGCCLSPQFGYLMEQLRQPPAATGPLDVLLGPWRLMADIDYFENVNHVAAPALIALIPGLLLVPYARLPQARRGRKAAVVISVYAALYYLLWYFNRPRAHYLAPLWPALALIAAFAASGLVKRSRVVAWATVGVIGVSLMFNLGLTGLINAQLAPVVLGLETRDEFLRKNTWYYDDIQYVNRTLPQDALLFSFPMGTYYLERDFVPAAIQMQTGIVDYYSLDSAQALLARWQELGITHVLWDAYWFWGSHNLATKYGLPSQVPQHFDQLVEQGHLLPVYERDTPVPTSRALDTWQPSRVVLYEVRY